jgi:predicted RNA-binding protein YlqC (UPF0109 family)
MKNLLEFLLIHIVTFPEDVRIEESETERGTVFTLFVNAEDMGRVIGKNGAVIESIRKIAKVRAVKEGIRATIVLADPEQTSAESIAVSESEESAEAAA